MLTDYLRGLSPYEGEREKPRQSVCKYEFMVPFHAQTRKEVFQKSPAEFLVLENPEGSRTTTRTRTERERGRGRMILQTAKAWFCRVCGVTLEWKSLHQMSQTVFIWPPLLVERQKVQSVIYAKRYWTIRQTWDNCWD